MEYPVQQPLPFQLVKMERAPPLVPRESLIVPQMPAHHGFLVLLITNNMCSCIKDFRAVRMLMGECVTPTFTLTTRGVDQNEI